VKLKITVLFGYVLCSVEYMKLGVFVEKWNKEYFHVLKISVLEVLPSA
jgi:hypothetical protein